MVAALIASCTGLSYAELCSVYPKEAAEYNYVKAAFNRRTLSFLIGWMMILASVVAAVTVALGFAGYFSHMFGGNIILIAIILILILSIINYIGIQESSNFNVIATLIEVVGLLVVIGVGLYIFLKHGFQVDLFELPPNTTLFHSIFVTTSVIFFAYLGFEDIVNVAEETKNARKVVPKALVISIIGSTILYCLVALSSVGILGWEKLAASKAPLTEVVSSVIPNSDLIFSLIALFATANTSLILLIVGSRVMYGMSKDKSIPKQFSKLNKNHTPTYSIIFVTVVSILLALIGNIKTIGLMTDLNIFLVYGMVNLSLITLRYKKSYKTNHFRTPFNIGKMPVLALLGFISSIFMLFYFEKNIFLLELVAIVIGFILYRCCKFKS